MKNKGNREEAFLVNGNANRLEGSWSASVAFTNCRTGSPVSLPFAAMNTFMRGGTMQDFGVTSGMLRSQGHGVWKYEGGLNYSKAFQFFRFNTDGTYAEKLSSDAELSSDPTTIMLPRAELKSTIPTAIW